MNELRPVPKPKKSDRIKARHERKASDPNRSSAITESAKGETCTICGICDETIVWCHLPLRCAGFGGIGLKVPDILGYYGCFKCHTNEPNTGWMELLIGFARSVIKLVEEGIIEVKK